MGSYRETGWLGMDKKILRGMFHMIKLPLMNMFPSHREWAGQSRLGSSSLEGNPKQRLIPRENTCQQK
jgi:hypothetical protein